MQGWLENARMCNGVDKNVDSSQQLVLIGDNTLKRVMKCQKTTPKQHIGGQIRKLEITPFYWKDAL